MYLSRRNYGICLLALALTLALVGAGWAQTATPTAPDLLTPTARRWRSWTRRSRN